jgi:cell wall-associated NlpC family hydrolase
MIFRKINVKLPHSSQGQSLVGLDVNSKNIQKGDLIFFKGRGRRRKNVGHVGMVVSEKGEPVKFIHASVSGGVRIDALSTDYYRKRFLKVKRVFNFEGK